MADVEQAASSSGSSGAASAAEKRAERMKKLRELHQKRVSCIVSRCLHDDNVVLLRLQAEASKLNHQEVVEEYKRNQLPKNWEKKREWAVYKLEEQEKRDQQGDDYNRIKALDVQADEAERQERRKKAKEHANPGFSGFEDATARSYNQNVKKLKPDMDKYEEMKEELGEEAFYCGKDTIIQGMVKDSKAAVDRLVEDVNKQIAKRDSFSRRRAFDDEADIDYINERNMKFNKKLERFYGQYTEEIKQNLERGTAV